MSHVPDLERTVVPRLVEILATPTPELPTPALPVLRRKFHAAGALAEIGPKASAAVPILVEQVGKGGIDPLNLEHHVQRDWSAQGALVAIGAAAVEPTSRLLESDDGWVRLDALRVLGAIGTPALAADERIARLLAHSSHGTREQTLTILQQIGATTNVLREALLRMHETDERAKRLVDADLQLPIRP